MSRSLLSLVLLVLLSACTQGSDSDARPPVADNEQVQNRGADKDNWWDSLPRPEWSAFEQVAQSEDWFEVYRIDDDIYAIYEPGQFEEVISFLIVGNDFALMFDTGLGIGNIRRVVDQLTDKDVVVLNSHTHYDHIGGNHLFDTIYGTRLEFTAMRSQGSPPEAVSGFLREGWVWKPLPDGIRSGELPEPCIRDRSLRLGGRHDRYRRAGSWRSCLRRDTRRTRFACSTGRTACCSPGIPSTSRRLYTHLPESSFDDYVNTAARLAALAGRYRCGDHLAQRAEGRCPLYDRAGAGICGHRGGQGHRRHDQ